MLYSNKTGYMGHALSTQLPVEVDNRLYTLMHVVGGFNFEEVHNFVESATPPQLDHFGEQVKKFPSTISELTPYTGQFELLKESVEFKTLKNLMVLKEQSQTKWDPTFNEYISPDLKEKLFNYWTKVGNPDWGTLKLFGVDTGDISDSSFDDVLDIVYPVLKIEWEGGVDKTSFGLKKDEWRHAITNGIYDIRFKVIPTSYTYSWDNEMGGGDRGYACWNLTFLIDKESWWRDTPMTEIFPNKTTEDVMNSMEDHQAEIIEELWEWIATEAQHYFHQYCKVTVKIV
jgi:hypothetical protein